ncbi:cold-shock protein [Marinobacter sp. X15-166B]|uniref:cold-shock protein n=1 Tax=Marinobacter sp. X15-166B TaxID=1897620 RepID=UPI00085CD13A|nr:cold shock domain-containing protein [Marinobacter sp. X15-166B]OEY67020.1 cold-shock protein [Marinobacter sp. X15-166B]
MRNPAKAILLAILIAIPAPFILTFALLAFTPEVFLILSQAGSNESASNPAFVIGSAQGIAAYLIAVLLFGLAGFLAIAFAGRQRTGNRAAPARHAAGTNDYEDDYDDEDEGPEGDEDGTVKWFNVKKGFGFIVRENGEEVFVHFRAIRGRGRRVLRQGQLVRFNVIDADKGLQADNVSILSDE